MLHLVVGWIMMLTVYEDPDHIFKALSSGASGYLLKRTPQAEIMEAIAEVHRGNSPMSGHIARKVFVRDHDHRVDAPLGGDVLDHLGGIGVKRVEWVLFTDHHREQVQGAARLRSLGAKTADGSVPGSASFRLTGRIRRSPRDPT